eukprot:6209828-Pleurochrysis_carterae.AAC.1
MNRKQSQVRDGISAAHNTGSRSGFGRPTATTSFVPASHNGTKLANYMTNLRQTAQTSRHISHAKVPASNNTEHAPADISVFGSPP